MKRLPLPVLERLASVIREIGGREVQPLQGNSILDLFAGRT